MSYSPTEENYLKAIYHLSRQQKEVSTNALAEGLQTKAASVTDMLRKLAAKELIHYVKYKGVNLTPKGEQNALQIIRKHRLWEVFLVEKLKLSWEQVHEIAEQLEHIDSALLIDRLDEFLGFPDRDPHGEAIPKHNGEMPQDNYQILAQIDTQNTLIVQAVSDDSPAFLRYLNKIGICIGIEIFIIEKIDFNNALEIQLPDHKKIILSQEVAQNILVKAK